MIDNDSVVKPKETTQEDLLVVHTQGYLDSLQVLKVSKVQQWLLY